MLNSKNYSKEKSFNFFLLISFILSIVPLIVRMTIVQLDENIKNLIGGQTQFDLFSQRKAFFLMLFAIGLVIISILFFRKIFSKKDKIVYFILIASSIFFIFTLLSAIFSKYRTISFYGIYDRAEGMITITSYLVLFIYSIYTFKNTKDYKYITIPLLILVSINGLLGIFQFIGQDLIKTPLGGVLAIPKEYNINSSQINLNNGNSIYGTLFNSNYVGSFTAITLPIFFCLTIFEEEITDKIFMFIGTCLSIWLLLGSNARSGLIGIVFAAIAGIIIFLKPIIQRWKFFLITFLSFFVLVIGANFALKGIIFERIGSIAVDAISLLKSDDTFDYRDHVPVRDIKHVDKGVQIVLQNDTLNISYENNNFVFKNSKSEVIPFTKTDMIYTTTDPSFNFITLWCGKFDKKSITTDSIILRVNNVSVFAFRLKEDKSIHLVDYTTKQYTDVVFPKTFGFNGKELIGSSRGYIWSRSIPLLKENIILGGGPDTFTLRFPQHDYIGKYYAQSTPNIFVDKPHNLYLQIGLSYGIVALIAFLVIMLIYIVDSFKLYSFKNTYEKSEVYGIVTTLGVIGYLFAGFFNDSIVSVAPVFWIVLGVGIAINFINRKTLNLKLLKKI